MKGCSELPWHEMVHEHDAWIPPPLQVDIGENRYPNRLSFRRDRWYNLVEDYSSRSLTKESDKLPAMAGLATNFHNEIDPGQYFAGIWLRHLPFALMWRTLPPSGRVGDEKIMGAFQPRRPQEFRAPSWSWASLDGEIGYESQRHANEPGRETYVTRLASFEIITPIKGQSLAFDALGKLPEKAYMLGEGCVAELGCDLSAAYTLPSGDNLCLLRQRKSGEVCGALFPDILDEFHNLMSVHILRVMSESYNSATEMPRALYNENSTEPDLWWTKQEFSMGLALIRVGEGYRRIGLARWLHRDIFVDHASETVRLV